MPEYGVIPHGFKGGCLPRASKPGQWCPMFSSRIKVIPREEWHLYTGKVSLEQFIREILNQGSVGSCAAESATQNLMITRAVAGLPHISLNPYFVYHHTSGGRDGGSSIDSNLKFLREYGCAPMSIWPRSHGFRTKPSADAYEAAKLNKVIEFYDITNVMEMVTALFKGFAVTYGANSHAVTKYEHVNDKFGNDVNSWGTGWKNGGKGPWVPYSQINWGYGAFAIRTSQDQPFDIVQSV